MAQLTVVIGVEKATFSTLAKWLPNAWRNDNTGIRYMCIDTRNRDAIAWKWVDVNISEETHNDTAPPGVRVTKDSDVTAVVTARHSKFAQADFINRIFSNREYWPEFLPLRAWKEAKDYDGDNKSLLVMRPSHGARGIGQLVYDPKLTTTDTLTKAMILIAKKPSAVPQENNSGDELKIKSLDKDDDIASYNKQLRETFASVSGAPYWYSDGDRSKSEGYSVLQENSFIQEYAADIESEYRVIIGGNNEPVYALKRKRNAYGKLGEVELNAACGEDVGPEKAFTDLRAAGIPHYVLDGFKKLCQHNDFSLFSFDVFITRSGKWGILEFCNEFGQCSVPNGLVNREIKKFIERITSST